MRLLTFKAVCTALWGRDYRSEAARVLDLHLRTLMRYDAGERRVPEHVSERLHTLLQRHHAEVGRLLTALGRKS